MATYDEEPESDIGYIYRVSGPCKSELSNYHQERSCDELKKN